MYDRCDEAQMETHKCLLDGLHYGLNHAKELIRLGHHVTIMAKKKETKKVELKEVSRVEINGNIIITYEDGSVKIIPAPIMLTADQASEIFGSEDEEEEDDE